MVSRARAPREYGGYARSGTARARQDRAARASLRHLDRKLLTLGLARVAVDIVDAAVDPGGDLEAVVVAVAGLEGRRAHVRDAGGPFLRLQFGDLAEILHIAFAGGAGEIEGDASARLGGRLCAGGSEQLQFIDGPMRRQRERGFGARGARSGREGREGKSRENESRASQGRGSAIKVGELLDFKAVCRLAASRLGINAPLRRRAECNTTVSRPFAQIKLMGRRKNNARRFAAFAAHAA